MNDKRFIKFQYFFIYFVLTFPASSIQNVVLIALLIERKFPLISSKQCLVFENCEDLKVMHYSAQSHNYALNPFSLMEHQHTYDIHITNQIHKHGEMIRK